VEGSRTSPEISPVTLVQAGHSSQAGQSVKVMVPPTPAVPTRTQTCQRRWAGAGECCAICDESQGWVNARAPRTWYAALRAVAAAAAP
jgi:hypothetical protein